MLYRCLIIYVDYTYCVCTYVDTGTNAHHSGDLLCNPMYISTQQNSGFVGISPRKPVCGDEQNLVRAIMVDCLTNVGNSHTLTCLTPGPAVVAGLFGLSVSQVVIPNVEHQVTWGISSRVFRCLNSKEILKLIN